MSVADAPCAAETAPAGSRQQTGVQAPARPMKGDIDAARPRQLSGWGRATRSSALAVCPPDAVAAETLLAGAASIRGGLIARGAGRSYGDPAQNAGGVVVDMTALNRIDSLDRDRGLLSAGAGTTLGQLMRHLNERGYTLPVVPGTMHVTVGGAIAADVHGKNHFRDRSFGHNVQSLRLCTPAGATVEVSRERDADLFHATVGGMGLTGLVLEAVLKVEPLASPTMWADIDRTDDLEEAIGLVAEPDARYRYALAWIDLLGAAGGRRGAGRSVVVRSDYANGAETAQAAPRSPKQLRMRPAVSIPTGVPVNLVQAPVVRAFNELRWRRAPRQTRQRPMGFAEHFFPLDALGHWSRLYGPAGLVQYQFVVPLGQEPTLLAAIDAMRAARLPMYLAVLKRLGPGSGGFLSFPLPGLTLAVDIPAAAPGLAGTLHHLDEMVAAVGGRVYLAKDALMRPGSVGAMYPELERFRAVCDRVDPGGVLGSDMARRLDLRGRGRVGRR